MAENLSQLDLAIQQVDNTFQQTEEIRQLMISKVKDAVSRLYLDPNGDSDKITMAKLQTISTLQALIKDREAGAVTIAKTKMQKKDTESSAATGQMVVELLKSINLKAASTPVGSTNLPANLDAQVDAAIAASQHEIEDTELESNPDQ